MSIFEFQGFDFYYIVFMIFVIGACFGSFANVVVLRAFSGESIVLPPSKCPQCHNKLKWYHNIPILSYMFLKGKCGFCEEKISPQYPLVEFTVGVLFAAIFLKFGLCVNSVFLSIAALLCVVLAVTDIKEQVIFDAHAYVLAVVGLIYNFFDVGKSGLGAWNFSLFSHSFSLNKSFLYAIAGIAAGAVIMELLALSGKLLAGKRAFGEGDAFILGALGAVFRVQAIPAILILGCVVQVLIILPMFVKKLWLCNERNLLAALGAFTASVIAFKVLDMFDLLGNMFIFGIIFLFMAVTAFYSCSKLIQSAKKGEGLTYVPFGPPLVIAALVLLFV